jgi:hypothetical protein
MPLSVHPVKGGNGRHHGPITVGTLVEEILGRLSALNGAAGGPILGQQRADNEAGTANANGGQDNQGHDHLAPSRPAIMPDHCGPRRPVRLAGNRIECAEVVDEDARVGSSRRRYVELDPFAVSHRRTAPRMELGRRLWRLFDAPLTRIGGFRASFRESVHSAHFPQSRASAPKANAAMRANTAIMLRPVRARQPANAVRWLSVC